MDVKALVLLGSDTRPGERIAGVPLGLLDVLGRPLLHRVADHLYRYGVSGIAVVGDPGLQGARFLRRAQRPDLSWELTAGQPPWRAAQRAFSQLVQAGADLVIVLRLGPYAELDYEQLIQFHLDQQGRVTSVVDDGGRPLDTLVISASRRNDAAFLFRHRLQAFRTPCVQFRFSGYVNRMAGPGDFRCLAVDAFCGRAQIVPEGVEVKPGVWIVPTARVHRGARVLAPAFIGEHAKVRASAVITRCTALEHHAQIDCGTVVEDATVLPYTAIGAGLDVNHSVVGLGRLAHLRRNVEVEIADPKLIGSVSTAPLRALGSAASLASFFPFQFIRGLFGGGQEPTCLPEAVHAPASALKSAPVLQAPASAPAGEFPAQFVVARRYGNE